MISRRCAYRAASLKVQRGKKLLSAANNPCGRFMGKFSQPMFRSQTFSDQTSHALLIASPRLYISFSSCPTVCPTVSLSVLLSASLSVLLFVSLSVCLTVCLSILLSIHLSVYLLNNNTTYCH